MDQIQTAFYGQNLPSDREHRCSQKILNNKTLYPYFKLTIFNNFKEVYSFLLKISDPIPFMLTSLYIFRKPISLFHKINFLLSIFDK